MSARAAFSAAGILAAAVIWFSPLSLDPQAHRLVAILALVVCWWIAEPIPLPATALLGVSLAVVAGVADAGAAFAPFGHPLIFLFMGGFFLARSMSLHGLDRRIALYLLTRRAIAGRPLRSIAALIATTAFLSMWISNAATTAMIYPIALGILSAVLPQGRAFGRLAAIVMLAIAYSSSIGGISTPVGSTPNIIAVGMIERLAGIRLTFVDYLMMGGPLAIVACSVLIWLTLREARRGSALPRTADPAPMLEAYAGLGAMTRGEKNTLVALLFAVFFWIVPGLLSLILGKDSAFAEGLLKALPEAVVAVLAGCLLFLLPQGRQGTDGTQGALTPTLPWKEAAKIDWGCLLLFGGGLSLGEMIFNTGLAKSLGSVLVAASGGPSEGAFWVFTGLAVIFAIFFTETTSNTATANMMLPLVIAASHEAGFSPIIPAFGVAVACSLAFMLPVATPPNAIVYGSGLVPIQLMARRGLAMNLICYGLIMAQLFIISRFISGS